MPDYRISMVLLMLLSDCGLEEQVRFQLPHMGLATSVALDIALMISLLTLPRVMQFMAILLPYNHQH